MVSDAPGHVADSLIDAADDLQIRSVGQQALRFQRTRGTVDLAGTVDDGAGLSYPRSLLGEGMPFTE